MSNRLDRNPFCHEGPVRDPAHFFDRESDVRGVLRSVRKGQSVSIVGKAKIGKTSFLQHVADPKVVERGGLSPSKCIFFYVDCTRLACLSEDDCFGQIKRIVARTVASLDGGLASALERIPLSMVYDWLEQALSLFEVEDIRPIVQLDDFDRLATNSRLSISFYQSLRALTEQNDAMLYLVTSRLPLIEMDYVESRLTLVGSPFFNIFKRWDLQPFSPGESRDFLAVRLRSVGAAFPEFILESICNWSRGEPYRLQLAGACAYDVWCEHGCRLCEEHWGEIERRFSDEMAVGA